MLDDLAYKMQTQKVDSARNYLQLASDIMNKGIGQHTLRNFRHLLCFVDVLTLVMTSLEPNALRREANVETLKLTPRE